MPGLGARWAVSSVQAAMPVGGLCPVSGLQGAGWHGEDPRAHSPAQAGAQPLQGGSDGASG